MPSERWRQVVEIFDSAVQRPASQRAAYVDQACAGDASLRREVEALLAADRDAGGFLERPPAAGLSGWAGGPGLGRPAERLAPGTRLGSYEVLSFIGAGGMGCVYRARDERMGRDVALKVLPGTGSDDGDRLARFQKEVRAVAALSHPAIVTVHDVGEAAGTRFFAMELVEGRSLREIVAEGVPALRRTLAIATQVAQGLAAAHARGIVHRDLKPENVMVGSEGRVKILDFGLAKLLAPHPAGGEPADLATRPGLILGTAGYMSPEQACGREVDFRTDHFAFGAILYELLSGRRAFEAPSTAETLAAVVRDEPPPLPDGPAGPPLPLRWILDRCLAKEPAERYGSTIDLARDLERAAEVVSAAQPALGHPPTKRRPWAWAAGALALGLGLGSWLSLPLRERPAAGPPLFRYLTHSGGDFSLDVAPDGRLVAFASDRDGRRRIWIKQVATGAETALTEGPADDHPRFSSDGSSILFTRVEGDVPSLYHVSALGGTPRRLVADARAGDFSPDGERLVFLRNPRDGAGAAYLLGIAGALGEEPRIVYRFEALAANPPRFSPDSKRVAVTHAHGAALLWSILVFDVDAGRARVLAPPHPTGRLSPALWVEGGRQLLYSQADATESPTSGSLVKHELASGRVQRLLHLLSLGVGLDVAGPGAVAFTSERARGSLRELDLGPAGPAAGRWLTRGDSDDRQPSYASDGQRIVFSSNRDGQLDLWALSRSGALERLTQGAAEDWDPRLTAQGRLVWSSNRSGNFEIWTAEGDGSAPRQVTHDGVDAENPAVSPDGRWIVYASHHPGHRGLWRVRPDGAEARQLAAGNLGLPEISPDGTLVLCGAFTPPTITLRVLRLHDGSPVPFTIGLPSSRTRTEAGFIRGRARWMPDGRRIAFVDVDARGRSGVLIQDFVPGADTSATRRPLAGFDAEVLSESFGIAPDGSRLALALRERTSQIVLATGVAGVEP